MQIIQKKTFKDSLSTHNTEQIKSKLKDFINHKFKHPANGSVPGMHPGFGSNDKQFHTTGHFGNAIRSISHAHLTHNISVVYRVRNDVLELYGIYTHDDIGTGQPPNIRRQDSWADRWSNSTSEPFSTDALAPSASKSTAPAAPKQAPSSYAPKPKSAAPTAVDRVLPIVQRAQDVYPQRNLLSKYQSSNRQEFMTVLAGEVRYLQSVRSSGGRLYANQLEYLNILQDIAKIVSK